VAWNSASWDLQRADVRDFDTAGWSFTDLLANVDAVLTKPGYGTFAEAACNGTPLLYVPRDNWPEEAPMVEWLQQHGRCAAIDRKRLMAGELDTVLDGLWGQAAKPVPQPGGIAEAAEILIQQYITPP
jgi:UDP-N-acetylglucosamine:LPS N-acetylglucosamine transferase